MSDEFNPDSWDAIDGVLQPAQTPELVGHEAVLKRLCSAYASGRMHHAWLLSGPRGIGKATLAFRFADHIMRFPVQEEAPSEMTYRDDSVHGQTARGANPNLLVIRRP
jgi:DNA polymerase-3 subunit delta'